MAVRKTMLFTPNATSGRCYGTPLLLLFTLLMYMSDYSVEAVYYSYDITSTRVCNRFHKQEMEVTMSKSLILESRPETIGRVTSGAPLSCDYEVEAKGGFQLGVVSVVQRMSFRSQGDYCLDYIQTIYKSREVKGIKIKHKKKKDKIKKKILKHAAKTATGGRLKRDFDDDDDNMGSRICGDVLFGLHVDQNETMPPPFASPLPPIPPSQDSLLLSIIAEAQHFNPYQTLVSDASDVDPKGELKTHLFVSNRMLRVDEAIKMKVVYSAYQGCDGRRVPDNLFHCGYGLCISRALVNDGFVNCPFGDCIDETNCTSAKSANITARVVRYVPAKPTSSESGGTWGGVIIFLIVSGLIACCICYFFKKRRQKTKVPEQDSGDDRGTEFVDTSKQQPNVPGTYYPTQPAPGAAPGYAPPPGGQPGYYPLTPQQPPQGYAPQQPPQGYAPQPPPGYPGQQPPPGYPGQPPPPGQGYMPPPQNPSGQPTAVPYPTAGYPPGPTPYPPSTAAPSAEHHGAPPPLPPGGMIGFNVPMGGYPQPGTGDATAPPADV